MSNSLRPHGLQSTRLLCPWGFSRQGYRSGLPCTPPGDLPNARIEPRSPALQRDSLPSEPPGKLKNTGVGSLSLLQGMFPTQKMNQGLLHCRQILYQLSYQGSQREILKVLGEKKTHILCYPLDAKEEKIRKPYLKVKAQRDGSRD